MKSSGILVLLCTLATCVGCATTPRGEQLERIGVQALVMNRVIERASDREAKALEVLASVSELRTLLDFNEVTVTDLREAMMKRIRERDLEPSERMVALEMVNELEAIVKMKVGAGELSPEHKVTVNKVLGYVENAARMYVP